VKKKKEEEEDDREPSGPPRLPKTPASKSIFNCCCSYKWPCSEIFLYPFTLAANFKGPGTGRGVLGGSMGPVSSATQSPGRSRAIETAPPAGRGRGRGLLLLSDDSDWFSLSLYQVYMVNLIRTRYIYSPTWTRIDPQCLDSPILCPHTVAATRN
jgi:hypothetical protein